MVATAGITGCDDNFNSITLDKECIGSEKPDTDSCTCIDNTWKCDENSGNVCDEDECNGECIDGKCIAKPNCDKCMFSCDETGKCLCDLSCEDNCRTDGSCSEIECPTQCPGNCDDNGICIESVTCPVECPDDCSEEGLCYEVDEPVCPVECPFDCDEQGHCPDIICPVICETECGADAKCICPLSCQNGCNENGTCVCPSTCKAACNEDGTCACPKSCATSCDATGLCKCPEKCSENCNEDGECQAKCADLDVEKFYFGQAEVDLLINSKITLRESASSTLYMKTVGSQTKIDLSQIPCADKIKITVSDNTVIKAAKSGTGVKFTAINPGTATVTASVDGTEFKATIKVHVLNLSLIHI